MNRRLLSKICICILITGNLIKVIPAKAASDNVAEVYTEDGYIKYITEDKKATDVNRPTWGNTGFVIRLNSVNNENPLVDSHYAIVRFTDEGVKRDINDTDSYTKTSTYTITEKAIRKALRNSKYGDMEKEFDELIEKEKPIYLNGIFQVYHTINGVKTKYGPEIFTHKGGKDSKGKFLKGIYSAENWNNPNTFGQYFNIKVLYKPSTQPVSVEYRTQYNELLYEKDLGHKKIGTEVSPNAFPKKYEKNGYTYKLYRSYYINLAQPGKKVDNRKLSLGDSFSQVSERKAKVKSGGLKFVAMYKIEAPPDLETNPEEKEVEFDEPEPTAMIKADERGNEKFNIEDGIPSSENLYVNVFTTDYLVSYRFVKKSKVKTFSVNATKTYNLVWNEEVTVIDPVTEEEKIDYIPQTSTETVTKTVQIQRVYGYWVIDQLDIYALTSSEIKNHAFPDESIVIKAQGVALPEIIYTVDKEVDKHVFMPKNLKETYVLPGGTIEGNTSCPDIPNEDFASYVNPLIGELIVKNDKLIYNGTTIMSDQKVEKEGKRPGDIGKGKLIDKDTLYKQSITIPAERANDIYESSGSVTYTSAIHIGKQNEVKVITYDIDTINSVTVHTPTICDAQITDMKAYNQRITPDTTRASLILDKSFRIYLPTYGEHNPYLGYCRRDYAKYIASREVKFPFDVYRDTTYIPANTWIDINTDDTEYYLPTWVPEGKYTIELRAPAINSSTNSENSERNANYELNNYVAIDTIDVEVSGRIYDLTIYDISDYPTWQEVFRKKDSLKLSGVNYKVGIRDQNGETTGRQAIYTFPLVAGSHPTNHSEGVINLGYCTRFKLTTIGEMYGPQDSIRIIPRFYHVDKNGHNRQEVDLYYTETFLNKRNYLVKVGSEKDKLNVKSYILGNRYWQVPEDEINATANVLGKTTKQIRLQKDDMFNFGNISLSSTFRTYHGTQEFMKNRTIPKSIDQNKVLQSVQNWYGEYYLPSDVHVLPKGLELYNNVRSQRGIDFTEGCWLKGGYIIVNFDIQTIQGGMSDKPHLSYINKENALNGYCNMWNMEGAQLVKTDTFGTQFNFKYGDYVMYHLDQSAAQDYRSAGTH